MEQLQPLFELVSRNGYHNVYPIIILALLRPLGLLFGFVAITWAIGAARLLRMSVALAIGIPMLVVNAADIETLIESSSITELAVITPKEFMIGYALGLLTSLPFIALQYAGEITDAFRGESDSGLTDPLGGRISTFGMLYMVVGLSAFFAFGGLEQLVGNLYRSYTIWPLAEPMPAFAAMAPTVILQALSGMLLFAIKVATPLLAALVVIEFICAVAARMARRFTFHENAFLLKNVTAIVTLPVMAWFVWLLAGDLVDDQAGSLFAIEALFQ
jgi:type III secretion protein T